MNIQNNLEMRQFGKLCSCGHELWCCIGKYDPWAICTRCKAWLYLPDVNYQYGKADVCDLQLLLAEEYKMSDDVEQTKIMALLLGGRNNG